VDSRSKIITTIIMGHKCKRGTVWERESLRGRKERIQGEGRGLKYTTFN
jgi:hypothetical protein